MQLEKTMARRAGDEGILAAGPEVVVSDWVDTASTRSSGNR